MLKERTRTLAVLEMFTTAGPAERTTETTGVTRPMGPAWTVPVLATTTDKTNHVKIKISLWGCRMVTDPLPNAELGAVGSWLLLPWSKYGRYRD